MNDAELDEILNSWSAPAAPASLRRRVRDGFPAPPQRKAKWIAAAILAAAAFSLIVAEAFPQVRGPVRAPWTVDSEFLKYAEDGSASIDSIEMYSTSYSVDGNETIWSRSIPGNPFKTALGTIIDVALPIHNRIMTPLMLNAQQIERMKRARAENFGIITGCGPQCLTLEHFYFPKAVPGCIAGAVVARERILNYPTAAVRQRWTEHGRMTLWTAPDLGCFALRVTFEEERPGGDFHLVAAKQAVKVTVNP
jgi:hypothetical protein